MQAEPQARRVELLGPMIRNRKGSFFGRLGGNGYAKCGRTVSFIPAEKFRLDRFREHDIEIVVGGGRRAASRDLREMIAGR